MGWKMCRYVVVAVGGLVAVDSAAAAVDELPLQETEYKQGHNRRPDIWAEQVMNKKVIYFIVK
jgi:hypothetical protein